MAALAASCGPARPEPASPGTPVAGVVSSPASATPTTLSKDELLTAIRFRRAFGLRDDTAWIHEVAANPASAQARLDYGTPLLPAEAAELLRHTANAERIAGPIRWYGEANPDTWAGMFLDHEAGGAIVAQFSADVEHHREHLSALLPDDARFEVREAAWSLRELEAFGRQVEDDPWLASIGAAVTSIGPDEAMNQVVVWIESRDPTHPDEVADHYGNPDWLADIVWEPPAWTGARGTLIVEVVNQRGRPIKGLYCRFVASDPLVGDDTFAYSTDDSGRCVREAIPAVEYQITIERAQTHGEGYTPVGTARVAVAPGGRTTTKIIATKDGP